MSGSRKDVFVSLSCLKFLVHKFECGCPKVLAGVPKNIDPAGLFTDSSYRIIQDELGVDMEIASYILFDGPFGLGVFFE